MFLNRSQNALLVVGLTVALSAASFAAGPASNHVIVVVLENHSFSEAWADMPWLRSLAKSHGYVKYYYGNTHPSIGNYFMMTTGKIITNNDGFAGTVTANNLARQFITAGKTWKVYAESLPYAGYVGGNRYPYVKHHNPFAYFSDVRNSSVQKYNIVPFSRFDDDLAAGHLPNFSFVVPNMHHDGHDGSLATADSWLKAHIGPVLSTAEFHQDGILVITFDESFESDTTHGGGRVLTVITGPGVGPGKIADDYYYQHQSLLRTIENAIGLPLMGAAKYARSLAEIF